MTIKRKTQLNLSGSHRNLDADFAQIGSALFVTGSVSGSTGRFTYLSGALSASSTGLPFLVAGSNITANWSDTNLNWEITGSGGGGTPAGDDRTVQFNNNGAFAGDVDFQFYSNSLGNIGANTLAFPSGNVGVLSGSNIDNQAYTLVFSGAVASIPGGQGGPFPGVFDPAMVVLTPVLMSQSLMLFDGYHDPLGLGDPDANVPGGGLALANDARFTLYSGSWNPLSSDFGGKDPVVSIYNNGNQGGSIDLVGQLMVLSSSTNRQNVFEVGVNPAGVGVQLKSVGTANFVSGAVNLTNGSNFTVFSGSGGFGQFYVAPSFTSGKVDASLNGAMTITSGSLYVNSGSSSDSSFQIEPSATAAQVNVIFDRTGSTGGVNFQGINVRPLYSSMTTSGSAGTEMSGSLLLGSSGPNGVGKVDFNVVAVQKNTDNYGSWTFSTTVARDTAGATSVIAYSELDAATSGSDAATWDVNINSDAVIYCTGSAGAEIQWYAHVTKKMFLSGSGLITY